MNGDNGYVATEPEVFREAGAVGGNAPRASASTVALSQIIRVLLALSFPWATLGLAASAFAFAMLEPTTPRILAAVLFTTLTHVPTWACWRKG